MGRDRSGRMTRARHERRKGSWGGGVTNGTTLDLVAGK